VLLEARVTTHINFLHTILLHHHGSQTGGTTPRP